MRGALLTRLQTDKERTQVKPQETLRPDCFVENTPPWSKTV